MIDTVGPYNRGVAEFTAAYEAHGFEQIHAGAMPFLPERPGLVLDVGAGSGRDAGWFAQRGWEVIAAEPAEAMRQAGAALHPSPRIRWVDDRLPGLTAVHRLGLAFDLVWLSGVWMHVPPEERRRAMRKLALLLKPGGRMVLTLRHGPSPDDRPMWPVDAHEVERLGLEFGLALRVATERCDDLQGRPDVRWQTVILDLPDDGGSALPLGLVALYWLRMFKPLLERGLPQMPERPGASPAFAREAFRALAPLAPTDLRPGALFAGDPAGALRRALADAARTIAEMPATHLTYADDTPVFPTRYERVPGRDHTFAVTEETLWTYGVTRVPLPVWFALRRMSAWIEPMLVAEWARLSLGYAARAGRTVTADELFTALRWTEPERDTRLVRELALRRLEAGRRVHCVWTGRALAEDALDIDHCLPWSAWACNDLWNLLPTSREVNQRSKRERLVAAPVLAEAKPLILAWWEEAYARDEALRRRFAEEVRTSLPVAKTREPEAEEVFAAVEFRRLRLMQEADLPEWRGPVPRA